VATAAVFSIRSIVLISCIFMVHVWHFWLICCDLCHLWRFNIVNTDISTIETSFIKVYWQLWRLLLWMNEWMENCPKPRSYFCKDVSFDVLASNNICCDEARCPGSRVRCKFSESDVMVDIASNDTVVRTFRCRYFRPLEPVKLSDFR